MNERKEANGRQCEKISYKLNSKERVPPQIPTRNVLCLFGPRRVRSLENKATLVGFCKGKITLGVGTRFVIIDEVARDQSLTLARSGS